MKINRIYIVALVLLIFTSSCQSIKEGVTGTKRANKSEEFFVKKKSPLVLPPDYSEMPKPKKNKNKSTVEELDIESLFKMYKEDGNAEDVGSLEKIILDNSK